MVLRPVPHPFMRRHSLIWLADRGDRGRLALGLTSYSLSCDRMEHLLAVDTDEAVSWTRYARQHGINPDSLRVRGANPRAWWVSTVPLAAVEV